MSRKCPWCEWTTVYAEAPGDEHAQRSNDAELADHKARCPAGRLRDRFAMAAVMATNVGNYGAGAELHIANHAWAIADAMLATREAKS